MIKEYKEAKKDALKNREQLGVKEMRQMEVLYSLIKIMRLQGYSPERMAEEINKHTAHIKISYMFIMRFIKKMSKLFNEAKDEWEFDIEDTGEEEDEE